MVGNNSLEPVSSSVRKLPRRLFLLLLILHWSSSFSIDKTAIPGIWKMFINATTFSAAKRAFDSGLQPTHNREATTGRLEESMFGDAKEILLKINPDGSFRECSEGYQEGRWISGMWKVRFTDQKILFACDRQYYGPRIDSLLEGTFQKAESGTDSITIEGDVYAGKFMYPKHHSAFFDEPLAIKNMTGRFSMHQVVSTTSVLGRSSSLETIETTANEDLPPKSQFDACDFYGRKFFLTVAPLKERKVEPQESTQPVDIRAMPIQFFRNNTFQAFGVNKILRGRFGIISEMADSKRFDRNKLWLQVSLFGAGRSAPGSVYSEGIGLTHDDKRNYIGEIMPREDQDFPGSLRLFVSGTVTFGSDMGTDARPEPVGIFEMFETREDMSSVSDDEHDSERDNVFQ